MELAVDVVVEGGFKFASPGVEAEVEEMAGLWGGGVGGEEGYEGVVACPGVVGVALKEGYVAHCGTAILKCGLYSLDVGRNHKQLHS